MTTRTRIIVTGRVQGVGFRASCSREAKRLGLGGSVQNTSDGSVEVVAEGDDVAVESLIDWCRSGPPFAHVVSVDCIHETPEGEPTFRIIGHTRPNWEA